MVILPNLSKRCEGATVPARTALALRNCHSVSDFIVSLPNVSKKDVKGLLFRKQPLHTSPNRLKEGKKRNLFPFLKNPTLSLDGAREWKAKPTAPSPRDSENWL